MLNCINLFYVYVDVGMVNCSIFFDLITIDICEFTGGKFMNKVLVIILNMLILCIFFRGCNSNQSLLDNADSDSIINNSSYDENADAYFKEASLVIEKGTAGYIERATELLDNALYESQDVNRTGLICLNLIESFDEGFDEYFDQQIYEFMDSHLFWHIIPYVEKGKPLIFTKNGKGLGIYCESETSKTNSEWDITDKYILCYGAYSDGLRNGDVLLYDSVIYDDSFASANLGYLKKWKCNFQNDIPNGPFTTLDIQDNPYSDCYISEGTLADGLFNGEVHEYLKKDPSGGKYLTYNNGIVEYYKVEKDSSNKPYYLLYNDGNSILTTDNITYTRGLPGFGEMWCTS